MKTTRTKQGVIMLIKPIMRKTKKIGFLSIRRPALDDLSGLLLTDVARMDISVLEAVVPRLSTPAITAEEVGSLHAEDIMLLKTMIGSYFLTRKALAGSGIYE